ncbi:hypothetical protein [Vibrio parahaemolyticus]|uniref:hypothetical protein n=1 Tax=Vibrio parahaemolyticus TaxID=670 RepID=UPI00228607B8|nr:hypothetical protein [Vibrio parahaemolyticus]MCZ0746694.1 hypothetical protein [Vibrio parahaemolyticus]
MRRKHEQSIIDAFSNYFLKKGQSRGKTTNRLSLDGQDSILGADYIFTENSNFALVEFKYEDYDLKAEGDKELRSTLCTMLDSEVVRRNQSLQCHYIAWSRKQQERRGVLFNKYYPEICNKAIFPRMSLRNTTPDISSRVSAANLVDQFLDGSAGASFEVFNRYVNWLLSIGGKQGTGVEVMLDNPDSNELDILEFSSLELLNNWLIQNRPQRAPSRSPSP